MHVKIEHQQYLKKRLLGVNETYQQVLLSVTLSELERHTIQATSIDDLVVVERPPSAELHQEDEGDGKWNITYGWLLTLHQERRADVYNLLTPFDAREYEEKLREALDTAKRYLEGNVELKDHSSRFRL